MKVIHRCTCRLTLMNCVVLSCTLQYCYCTTWHHMAVVCPLSCACLPVAAMGERIFHVGKEAGMGRYTSGCEPKLMMTYPWGALLGCAASFDRWDAPLGCPRSCAL